MRDHIPTECLQLEYLAFSPDARSCVAAPPRSSSSAFWWSMMSPPSTASWLRYWWRTTMTCGEPRRGPGAATDRIRCSGCGCPRPGPARHGWKRSDRSRARLVAGADRGALSPGSRSGEDRGAGPGADDFVTKPFGAGELMARLRAALRHRLHQVGEVAAVRIGEIEIDILRRRVTRNDVEVRLSPREFNILALLARHAGQVVTHTQVLSAVWGGVAQGEYPISARLCGTLSPETRAESGRAEDCPHRARYWLPACRTAKRGARVGLSGPR